jgi:hypothetical protein
MIVLSERFRSLWWVYCLPSLPCSLMSFLVIFGNGFCSQARLLVYCHCVFLFITVSYFAPAGCHVNSVLVLWCEYMLSLSLWLSLPLWCAAIIMVGPRAVRPRPPRVVRPPAAPAAPPRAPRRLHRAPLVHPPPGFIFAGLPKRKCMDLSVFLFGWFYVPSIWNLWWLWVYVVPSFAIGDGFFPLVSREVATRNWKRRKVIHDRLLGRIPGACLLFSLLLV